VRLVTLDSGHSIVFLVQVSESNIIYCALGMLYKYTLLEGDKNHQGVGKLPQLPLGTSNFDQTCGIAENTYQITKKRNFKT
jgi:hypothetical protein